jgi:hypothetical protein
MTKTVTALWQQWDNIGLEYLSLTETNQHIQIDSVIIGFENKTPFRLHYQIRCDVIFKFKKSRLTWQDTPPLF